MARWKRYNELVFLEILNGDIMKITIISDGPWIVEMRDEIGKLDKEDANALWEYMITSLNTTQYPEDE